MTTTVTRPGPVATLPQDGAPPEQQPAFRHTPGGFRPDIEGLRAVAVLAVVADHLFARPRGGFVGVDVFFVISGFLITGLLLKEHHRIGRISFATFYRRRVRRIIPVAVLVLVVTVAATYLLFSASRVKVVGVDALWALGFSANYHFALIGTDYWQADGPVSPLQHFWSLAVEEQFYLFWPLVILLVLWVARRFGADRQRAGVVLAVVLAGLCAASFADSLWETESRRTWAYFSTSARAWELGVGALLAVLATRLARLPELLRPFLAWTGLAGIAVSLFAVSDTMAFPGPWAAAPVLSTALVIAAGTGAARFRIWPLTNAAARYVGRISYSLYLWHFPVIVLLLAVFPAAGRKYFLSALVTMAVLAVGSFHLVENPIRKSAWLDPRRRSGKLANSPVWVRVALVGVLAVPVVVLAGESLRPAVAPTAATALSGADPQRALSAGIDAALAAKSWPALSPAIGALTDNAKAPEWVHDGCLGLDVGSDPDPQKNAAKCVYGPAGATKTAVVLGDSIAISYLPAIRAALGDDWRVHVLTVEECPFASVSVVKADGTKFPACDTFRTWALAQAASLKPDLVIASNAENTVSRLASGAQQETAVAEYAKGEATSLAAVAGSGTTVKLLAPPPIGKNLQQCATKLSTPADCVVGPSDRRAGEMTVDSAAMAQQGMNVSSSFVDTTSWFCSTGGDKCPAFVGTTPVSVDGAHLTAAYAAVLTPVVGKALLGNDYHAPAAAPAAATAGTAGGAAALQAALVAAVAAKSWPTMSPAFDDVIGDKQTAEDKAGCDKTDLTDPNSCSFGKQGARTILVMGDSQALKLLPTVRAAYESSYHIKGVIMVGCPLLDFAMSFPSENDKAACLDYRARAVAAVQAEKPDVLLVTNNYGATSLNTRSGSALDAWQKAAAELVTQLKPAVGTLALVAAPPKGADPGQCHTAVSSPADCLVKISSSWTDGFRAEQAAAALATVTYVDTHLWYCTADGYCPAFAGTTPMRSDATHISAPYAAELAPLLRQALTQVV